MICCDTFGLVNRSQQTYVVTNKPSPSVLISLDVSPSNFDKSTFASEKLLGFNRSLPWQLHSQAWAVGDSDRLSSTLGPSSRGSQKTRPATCGLAAVGGTSIGIGGVGPWFWRLGGRIWLVVGACLWQDVSPSLKMVEWCMTLVGVWSGRITSDCLWGGGFVNLPICDSGTMSLWHTWMIGSIPMSWLCLAKPTWFLKHLQHLA